MKNLYSDREARETIDRYPDIPEDLALRVYTSRLIGQEEDLVLHGGGNTSVKTTFTNILDEPVEGIFIKGSGWNLATIEPAGFPGLDLNYLRKLRKLESLSDEEMVNQFRTHMFDASAPNPSIETLVHAFLPHRFVDHSHADAIVTLTNQAEPESLLREALGPDVGILPFIMPGFPLAKAMAELYESRPEMDCIILRNHGIFTFADDAGTAYERMIHYVSLAEDYVAAALAQKPGPPAQPGEKPEPGLLLPTLRGQLAHTDHKGRERYFCLEVRDDDDILEALARPDAESLFATGVLTPDHVIRTKNYPLFLDCSGIEDEEGMTAKLKKAVNEYQEHYDRYFAVQVAAKNVERTKLDPMPRLVLVPDFGLVAAGKTPKEAKVVADIGEHTLRAKIGAAAAGEYKELDAGHIFDMEYWSLEQAKLGKGAPLPLEGRIALVTGGGGAIAVGIGRQLLKAGARLFLSDIDQDRLHRVVAKLAEEFDPGMVTGLQMDVSDEKSVTSSLRRLIGQAGGLDILVPNAGLAHVAPLAQLDEGKFRKIIDVNLMGVFQVIKAAIPVFRRQGTGGHVVINSSKNVFDPGASFGAYSTSKAGAHQLGRVAALELAEIGVRVNMINPDAIFEGDEVSSGLWEVVGPDRMRARNLDPEGLKEYYRQRNLLKSEIRAEDVGNAVVFFASGQTPTTGATLPVDGGIPAAFPR
ncbi:MAG: bifunctional aldolase/short-chain dehydrogenase [Desulfurivibrionaceae bacterium]